jgi:hypothetical protein
LKPAESSAFANSFAKGCLRPKRQLGRPVSDALLQCDFVRPGSSRGFFDLKGHLVKYFTGTERRMVEKALNSEKSVEE